MGRRASITCVAAVAAGLIAPCGRASAALTVEVDGSPDLSSGAERAPAEDDLPTPSSPAQAATEPRPPSRADAAPAAVPLVQQPATAPAGVTPGGRYAKPIAAGTVAAVYTAFGAWAYLAWFRGADESKFFFDNSAWFGANTYSGGADKLGHCWANYALSRLTTAVLVKGGWRPLPSSLVASGISVFFFTLSEIKDGYIWGFEGGDELANVLGAALSVLMVNVPRVDELFDFRVQYLPSRPYLHNLRTSGDLDVAQDYSGQSYMLALHLGALPRVTDPTWMRWARYVDLVGGFETRNYAPESDSNGVPRQTLYVGLSLNVQQVLRLFRDSTPRRIGHGVLELLSVPYTTLRAASGSRSPPQAAVSP